MISCDDLLGKDKIVDCATVPLLAEELTVQKHVQISLGGESILTCWQQHLYWQTGRAFVSVYLQIIEVLNN